MGFNNLTYDQLNPVAYPLANRFYKQAGEKGKTQGSDDVYVARLDSQIIAAVRLCPLRQNIHSSRESQLDSLLLRSLAVLPEYRRTGVGTQFMDYVAAQLSGQECWCYPFSWLKIFYAQTGFEVIAPENAPEHIRVPFENYSRQGRDILIMFRKPHQVDI